MSNALSRLKTTAVKEKAKEETVVQSIDYGVYLSSKPVLFISEASLMDLVDDEDLDKKYTHYVSSYNTRGDSLAAVFEGRPKQLAKLSSITDVWALVPKLANLLAGAKYDAKNSDSETFIVYKLKDKSTLIIAGDND